MAPPRYPTSFSFSLPQQQRKSQFLVERRKEKKHVNKKIPPTPLTPRCKPNINKNYIFFVFRKA